MNRRISLVMSSSPGLVHWVPLPSPLPCGPSGLVLPTHVTDGWEFQGHWAAAGQRGTWAPTAISSPYRSSHGSERAHDRLPACPYPLSGDTFQPGLSLQGGKITRSFPAPVLGFAKWGGGSPGTGRGLSPQEGPALGLFLQSA